MSTPWKICCMWPMRCSRFLASFLVGLMFASGLTHAEPIAATSRGATSAEEQEILWEDGQEDFSSRRFLEASQKLQRLADRYPSDAHRRETLRMLGVSYLELGRFKESAATLRSFVALMSRSPEGAHARVALGYAYLGLKKHREAYLTALEIERGPVIPAARAAGLVLKGKALLALKQEERAERALDAARPYLKELEKTPPGAAEAAPIYAQLWSARAEQKSLSCRKLPTPSRNERVIRTQMERRGVCLLEATHHFKEMLDADQSEATFKLALQTAVGLDREWTAFRQTCADPRAATGVRSSGVEAQRWKAELVDYLRDGCQNTFKTAIQIVGGWSVSPAQGHLLEALKRESQS